MTKCTYIVVCWKNAALSRKAIETALAQPDSAVIAIDNYSMDGGATLDLFEDFEEKLDAATKARLRLIKNGDNLGWVGGINQGIEIAKTEFPDSEFYCFLNNDVELCPEFWEKIEPHFASEDTGAVGPISNNVSGLQDYNIKGYPNHHEVKVLIGFCLVVRTSLVDQIGGLDPIFGWGLSDDFDFSLRIRKFGFRLFIARDCQVFHHGSKGVAIRFEKTEDYQKDLDEKTRIFIEKWSKAEYDDLIQVEMPCSGTIGIPHMEMVHSEFLHCFTRLNKPPNSIVNFVKGSLITKARNDIVKAMKGDWLLFIDSDMTFSADSLNQLLKHLEAGADIVGGLCFRRVPDYNPTLYQQLDGQLKWQWLHDYPRDSLFEVDATGSAFILIKKRVFDKMPYPWYEYVEDLSEDLYFCHKAKQLGFKILIDSSVKIGHLATFPVDEAFFDDYKQGKKFID